MRKKESVSEKERSVEKYNWHEEYGDADDG
jgi:hypothetical protein